MEEEIIEMFSDIKLSDTKNWQKFQRYHDVNLEVYRLTCILLGPFLKKHMFNFLTKKLLKLDEELRELKKEIPFLNQEIILYSLNDAYMDYCIEKMYDIREKYNIVCCYSCKNLFYAFIGGCLCEDCIYERIQ